MPETEASGGNNTKTPWACTEIVEHERFGDKTSSTALLDMIKLLPTRERLDLELLFRELFLQQLSPEIQQLLAQTEHTSTDQKNLKALAAQADLYFMSTGVRICWISKTGKETIKEDNVNAINTKGRKLCLYHAKFGKDARICGKKHGQTCDWVERKPKTENSKGRA